MLSSATIIGTVTHKTENQTKTGNKLITLRVKTTREFLDARGVQNEEISMHHINLFGKLCDVAKKVPIGGLICIVGNIRNIESEGKYYYSVQATEIKLFEQCLSVVCEEFNNDDVGNSK